MFGEVVVDEVFVSFVINNSYVNGVFVFGYFFRWVNIIRKLVFFVVKEVLELIRYEFLIIN